MLRHPSALALAALVVVLGCQPNPPAAPTATPDRPPTLAAPTATPDRPPTLAASPASPATSPAPQAPGPVTTDASRPDVLGAGDRALQRGEYQAASELYDRVVGTPPGREETQAVSAALDGLATFRAVVALTAAGREDEARTVLRRLRDRDPAAPFARLAGDFWEQYGMTADVRAACASLEQSSSQIAGATAALAQVGLVVDPHQVCAFGP